jgi:hypothetical protein
MPPVYDQLEYNNCVALSATAMKYWQETKESGFHGVFNPMFLYNQRQFYKGDYGMFCREALKGVAIMRVIEEQ